MNSHIDLENFFKNKDEMKAYCSKVAGKECIKCKTRNNGNYYKIFCTESDCQFQITYNRRDSERNKNGYYLVFKGTCLNHKIDCPNCVLNLSQTKDPKFISKQILPLFEEKSPSLNEIKSAIKCFNSEEFSRTELKYIKKLAKKHFFKEATSTISQLIKFCQELVEIHNWKLDLDFIEGMLSSIILFPPWAKSLIQYYHDPLIVDATFSCENLRFISAVIIDGEWNTQVVGLVIRGTEDTKGYSLLFQFFQKLLEKNP